MFDYTGDIQGDLFEFLELIDYTMSTRFMKNWKYKYSESLVSAFQLRLLKGLTDRKPVKLKSLKKELGMKTKFNYLIIDEFFGEIMINLYYPLVL